MRITVLATRVAMAGLIAAAIIAQLDSSIDYAGRDGDLDTVNVIVNFQSFFSVDWNSLSIVLLAFGAVLLAREVINPETSAGGYGSVAVHLVAIAVAVVAVAYLLVWTSRQLAARA